MDFELEETTIEAVQAAMTGGGLTALELTRRYLTRIEALDHNGPDLRSVIELNPDALSIAAG